MFRFTQAMNDFIRENREGRTFQEAVDLFNQRFGTDLTVYQMKCKYKNMHIHVGETDKVYTDLWPRHVVSFLEANNEGVSVRDMTERLNREFGTSYTEDQVRAYRKNHHLPCGRDTRFKPGNIPPMKGRRQQDVFTDPVKMANIRSAWFRKGNTPWNKVPVGTEVFKYGYWWLKVGEPNRWRQKHIVVWESVHGTLPDGMKVTFLNGDVNDMDPGNLMAVTLDENAHLLKGSVRHLRNRELTKAQALTWRLGKALEDIFGKEQAE